MSTESQNAADHMEEGSEVYRRKREDYGTSVFDIGEILWIMAGGEPVTLEGPDDFAAIGIMSRRLDKMGRAFNGEFCSDGEMNFEGVLDSHLDEMVYAALHAELHTRDNGNDK